MLLGSASASAGQDAGDLNVNVAGVNVRLEPYTLDQLDVGVAFDGRPDAPADGINTRRLRNGVRAKLPDDVTLSFVWDFGDQGYSGPRFGHSRLFESKIKYAGLDPFIIEVGAFEPNLTLQNEQTSAHTLFLTIPSIDVLASGPAASGGRVAAQMKAHGDRWLVVFALTGPRAGPGDDGRERAVLARAAGLVVHRENLDVHLGFSGFWEFRTPRESGIVPSVTLSDTVGYDVAPPPYFSTGQIAACSERSGGVETGLVWGPLWLESEWYRIAVGRMGGKDPWFGGWYAQAGWTLLGERRHWHSDSADWGAPSPRNDFDPAAGYWGAVEIGARYSTVNLDSAGVNGGRQNVWAADVSWWPVQHVRTILEWERGQVLGGSDPHRFQAVLFRLQLYYE